MVDFLSRLPSFVVGFLCRSLSEIREKRRFRVLKKVDGKTRGEINQGDPSIEQAVGRQATQRSGQLHL